MRRNFSSKCSKIFSIGLMIMFKVCRRCLQRCSLRSKKNYVRAIHTSKYIQKKADPTLTPLRGRVDSFNATFTRFGATCMQNILYTFFDILAWFMLFLTENVNLGALGHFDQRVSVDHICVIPCCSTIKCKWFGK